MSFEESEGSVGRIRSATRAHPVVIFFVLACGITWSIWIPVPLGLREGWFEIGPLVFFAFVAGSFGPLLAAAIVTYITGGSVRGWASQILRWRFQPVWWVLILLVPVGLYLGLMAPIHVGLGGTFDAGQIGPLAALPMTYIPIFLWGGGNEELGWRGFALPYLQETYSPFVSSLIIGVVWAIWHLPVGLIESTGSNHLIAIITVIGISIVTTWVYNNTGGSVLATMVLHAGVNGAQHLYPVEGLLSPEAEVARVLAWLILVAAILGIFGWRQMTTKPIPGATKAGAVPGSRSNPESSTTVTAD